MRHRPMVAGRDRHSRGRAPINLRRLRPAGHRTDIPRTVAWLCRGVLREWREHLQQAGDDCDPEAETAFHREALYTNSASAKGHGAGHTRMRQR